MSSNIVIDSRVIIPDLEGRILFLKRASKVANGMWNLPGGKVESMDSVNDTSRKEVMEESGLVIKDLDFLFFDESLGSSFDKKHYISFYLLANGYGGRVELNEESSDYDWVKPAEIPMLEVAFNNDLAVNRYLQGLRR